MAMMKKLWVGFRQIQRQDHFSVPDMFRSNILVRTGWQVAFALTACLTVVSSTEASMVEKFTLEKMVQKSSKIVIGRCLSTESRWNEKKTLILTYSTFAVDEDLKGQSNGVITVVTIGGTVGEITQAVAGMPQFKANQEALLFLEPSKKGNWQTLALSEGHFQIIRNPKTGIQEAVHSLSGLQVYSAADHTVTREETPSRLPLSQLVERIRALMRNEQQ
jgi:hypothetical protein